MTMVKKTESANSQFYKFLWAFILVALSACLGNVVDSIIVGNLINADGVSAINLSKPIIQFIFTINLLICGGGGMLVGFELGNNNIGGAKRCFTDSMVLSTSFGVLLTIFGGFIFPAQIANMLCDNEAILPLARDYMEVLLIGNPTYILMWGLSTMVSVNGAPRLVSAAVIIDNTVNLLLDIVFIKYFGWGIMGSSTATIVGHIVGIAILLSHWLKPANRRLSLSFSLGDFWKSTKRILAQGAPLAVASICLTMLLLSANSIVLSTAGRDGIFIFSVCMNLLQIYNLFLSGACQTLQSLGAIEAGKRSQTGLQSVIRKTFRFMTVSMIATCIYVWVLPQTIAELFGANEPQLISGCNHALRVFALSFVPFCYIYLLMIVYKLYGHHRMALFISFALSLTVIPVLWAMAKFTPQLMWYSYLVAYALEGIAIYALHKTTHVKFIIDNATESDDTPSDDDTIRHSKTAE